MKEHVFYSKNLAPLGFALISLIIVQKISTLNFTPFLSFFHKLNIFFSENYR